MGSASGSTRQNWYVRRLMAVEKQNLAVAEDQAAIPESWLSGTELSRSQKSGVALSLVAAIAAAIVLAFVLIGPVLNILGLQAIGA